MSTSESNKTVVKDFIDGLFTKVAARMQLEHVRASFGKVGVGSRRELVTVLLRGSASRG